MKKRILSMLMALSLLLCMAPAASAVEETPNVVSYPVAGGMLYFDKNTGTITDAALSASEIEIPAQIQGVQVTEIGPYSFEGFRALTSVTLPEGIRSIGGFAFYQCEALKHINIPDSVEWISGYAFWGCVALEEIHLPEGLTQIDEATFVDCDSLTELFLPESLTRIENYAFCDCDGLRTVTIPRNVVEIDHHAFSRCKSLERFTVASGNTAFFADGQGALYSGDRTVLQQAPGGVTGTFAVAPGVKVIGAAAFDGCVGMTGVTIPDGVTALESDAFYGCENLKEVVLPDSVRSIGNAAFGACKRLAKITIPDGVTRIELGAFYMCAMKGVSLPASLQKLDPNAFEESTLKCIVFRGTRAQWEQIAEFDLDIPVLFDVPQKDLPHYEAGCAGAGFTDAPACGDWAHEGIDFCAEYGLMNGVGNRRFNPGGTVSRAQLVTILFRLSGVSGSYYWSPFTDVPEGTWYSDAVGWASACGVVNGVGDGRFDPGGAITREQIATILYRHAGYPDASGSLGAFPDANSVSGYAVDAMRWAASAGLINGVKSGNQSFLKPKANATRAQIAAIIMRYLADDPYYSGEGSPVEFWTFQELHVEFYKMMAEQWNELHPDRRIWLRPRVYPYEDLHTNLELALLSDTGAPDMVDIEFGKFPNFLQGRIQLLPLNDIVEPELDHIVASSLDSYARDGKYYGIDYHVGAAVIFYNKELCQAAGINCEDIRTWDDYYSAAKKFKTAFPDKYWNSVESTDIWHMWGQLTELGADMTDAEGNPTINTPEMARVLEYNRKMIREGLATVAPGTYHHAEEFYWAMGYGDIASVVMPFWYLDRFTNYMPQLAGKIVTAPLPVWEQGQKRSVGQGGTATSVTDQADDPQLVKDFLAFCKLSGEGGVKAWQMLGFDPICTDVWSMDEVTHDPSNRFVQYFANNPFDTLLQIKDEIAGVNNTEALPAVLDTMKSTVLRRAYETNASITTILYEAQAEVTGVPARK